MTRYLAPGLLVAAIALLVGSAAYVFSERQSKEYEAVASLGYGRLLSPELQVLGNGASDPDVDDEIRLATEARRVNSFDVAERTARKAPQLGYSAADVASRMESAPARGTLVVVIKGRASSPEAANLLCQTYADEFLALVKERERKRAAGVERALRTRLARLPPGDQASLPGATLRNQIATLEVLQRVGSGSPQIIENARASSVPATPQTTRNVLFGVLFGLVLGIGLVALRAESRRRAIMSSGARTSPTRAGATTEW